jgi:hypothetical protein
MRIFMRRPGSLAQPADANLINETIIAQVSVGHKFVGADGTEYWAYWPR